MRPSLVGGVFILNLVTISSIPLPKLPGLFTPEVCLPMTDHSYVGDPDVSQEVVSAGWYDTLYCKRGCCGDSKDAYCCPQEPPEGLGTFQLISVVAAGIAAVTIITVTSVYLIKKHNKKRRLVRDINDINKMNKMKNGVTKAKADHYQKGPDVKKSKKNGKLFKKKTTSPPATARPDTPISILASPQILPDLAYNAKAPPPYGLHQWPASFAKPDHMDLISNLKPPSPISETTKAHRLSPSPPLPSNLPPPLILPPLATADVDDAFLDSLLATIPLEGTYDDPRPPIM